jgi:Na+/H+ antiporter NhaD/arsenite permease-like protein
VEVAIVIVFVLGYIGITMEHILKVDKVVPALLMMVFCWTIITFGFDSFNQWIDPHTGGFVNPSLLNQAEKSHLLEGTLLHHFGKTAEILIFLIGAMAIVEMIDHFNGFGAIKKLIKTKRKRSLLWIIAFLAFALSAIIDNLTATIVLITILRKLVPNQKDRMWYAGLIIISANAGGAWTPIGDVTTTMLWMAGKVTTVKLMTLLGLPSLVSMIVPVGIASFLPVFKGNIEEIEEMDEMDEHNKNASIMLILGLTLIVFVPIFKTLTHLPPYIGMMLSFCILAIVAEIISHRAFKYSNKKEEGHVQSPIMSALSKLEMPSILFFLGILLTVAAMESLGLIYNFGQQVSATIPENLFITLLGISSSIIDNVPLVAASIGMFQDAPDSNVWHFIAYAAGTGGSMLIIGSAAGVVAMGMEKITFFWYMKNITLLALLGYFAGVGVFLLMA